MAAEISEMSNGGSALPSVGGGNSNHSLSIAHLPPHRKQKLEAIMTGSLRANSRDAVTHVGFKAAPGVEPKPINFEEFQGHALDPVEVSNSSARSLKRTRGPAPVHSPTTPNAKRVHTKQGSKRKPRKVQKNAAEKQLGKSAKCGKGTGKGGAAGKVTGKRKLKSPSKKSGKAVEVSAGVPLSTSPSAVNAPVAAATTENTTMTPAPSNPDDIVLFSSNSKHSQDAIDPAADDRKSVGQNNLYSYFQKNHAGPVPVGRYTQGTTTTSAASSSSSSAAHTSPSHRKRHKKNSGQRSDNAALVQSLRQQLEATQRKVEELHMLMQEKDKFLEQKDLTVETTQQVLAKTKEQSDAYKSKVRALLADVLRESAERNKLHEQRELTEQRFSVGQIVPVREGHMVNEFWQDGYRFVQLEQEKQRLQQEKQELERLRKLHRKGRTAARKEIKEKEKDDAADKGDSPFKRPASVVFDDHSRQDEVYKLRIMRLKEDFAALEKEEQSLLHLKAQLIRRLRRCSDESKSRFSNHPILNKRYLLLRLLGKGGFSEVFKAFDLEEVRYVACKIHQLNPQWSDERKRNYTRHATREYNIHRTLDHKRVVSLFDVFAIDLNSFCTVLEYCNGPDLDMYLKQKKTLSEKEARVIIMQVFGGLKYLNEQKKRIIHYDLKPGNILFHNGEAKLTDFGLSKIVSEDTQDSIELTSQGAGTYWYLPPEVFDMSKRPKISSKVDVWSAGIILYQMLYGVRPFGHDMTQEALLTSGTIAKATSVQFPAKPKVSQAAKDFMKKCLAHTPGLRPSLLTIFNEPFLRQKMRLV